MGCWMQHCLSVVGTKQIEQLEAELAVQGDLELGLELELVLAWKTTTGHSPCVAATVVAGMVLLGDMSTQAEPLGTG